MLVTFMVMLMIMERCVSPAPRIMETAMKFVMMIGANREIVFKYWMPESMPEI